MTRPAGESSPRLSVIIATFNRAEMLRCALRSVLLQQYIDFEVIVVGDRCTDDSAAVVAATADPRVQWMNRDVNCGSQWGPNNDGLTLARGEYVAFLGHDDLWLPWHLKTLVPLLDAGADLAHPIAAWLTPEGVVGVFGAPPKGESYATTFVPPSGWVARKHVLQVVGGFRDHQDLTVPTDLDLQRRLFRAGNRIVPAPRLSVLKFPSHQWRAYDAAAAVPQQSWIARLAADAEGVERELLTAAVVALVKATPHAGPRTAIALAFRATLRWLRSLVDRDHGPFAPLLRARFRRWREVIRHRRGLSVK
ncbi:MAG: glycosyltransferase family A protein [Acidobacteriota bacterium]